MLVRETLQPASRATGTDLVLETGDRITYTYRTRRTKGRSWAQRESRSPSCGEVGERARSCRLGSLIET
jgi:hypothetical protein